MFYRFKKMPPTDGYELILKEFALKKYHDIGLFNYINPFKAYNP